MIKVDFNNNGTQDYEESWFWRAVARGFALGLLMLPKHTQGFKAGVWLKTQLDGVTPLPETRQ